MEEKSCCHYLDIFTLLSPLIFIFDVVADLWSIVSLYKEEKYISMGLMIFILLASSVLLQIFSWLWYSEPPQTRLELFLKKQNLLLPVHILQLGVFLRILAAMDDSIHNSMDKTKRNLDSTADIIMLKLFEMFTESVPQIVLMTVLIMQTPELHLFTVVKLIGSLSSMAFSRLSFHRNIREYVSKELKIGHCSSPAVLYFLWNLFLIGPRVVCVSLFASVLPCYIVAHFLSLWTLLVLWAWWQTTEFNKARKWLYRATLALIWYFSWFNVASGRTKLKGIIYHMVIGVDMILLLGLWWWRRSVESARLAPLPINPYLLIGMLIITYIIGVLLKLLYYWKFNLVKSVQLKVLDSKAKRLFVVLNIIELTFTDISGGEKMSVFLRNPQQS